MKIFLKWAILSLGFITFFHPNASAQEDLVISNVIGQASIIRGDKTMPATAGMACQSGDIIKTSPDCTLDIAMNKMAGARVLAGSECAIVDGKAQNMHLKIMNGNAILNLEKLPEQSSFKVETPTAVAAVRGTQFWGRVDLAQVENPVTTFAVREGSVEIFAKSLGKSFMLEQGQALDIPKDESVVPLIRPALEAELQAMAQADAIRTSA
jgi:hypothetical protein